MIIDAIEAVVARRDLSETEMMAVMEEVGDGRATPAQIGALIVALRMKGETADEIAGAARVLRGRSLTVEVPEERRPLLDIVGTGGDGTGTFNVSTTSAFVAAGAGATVAKHGNRGVSSSCGAADLLEALGVAIELTPEQVAGCITDVGIGFLFAPRHHPAMRHAVTPRRDVRLKSIFNLIGPLTNPAGAEHLLLGVYRYELPRTMAQVLRMMGCQGAFVVHGEDGCDEISISGPTRYARLENGNVTVGRMDPSDFGLKTAPLPAVRGGAPAENAEITRRILDGEPGPTRDMTLLNTAAALTAAGLAADMVAGVRLAAESIDSGRARDVLERLIAFSNALVEQRPAMEA